MNRQSRRVRRRMARFLYDHEQSWCDRLCDAQEFVIEWAQMARGIDTWNLSLDEMDDCYYPTFPRIPALEAHLDEAMEYLVQEEQAYFKKISSTPRDGGDG